MSGKVKGITIEIGGDTTKLTKALSEMKKETNSAQNELKQVEKLLKFDPKNTVLLTQKQELLGKQIDSVKDTLQTLKKAQTDVDEEIKNGVEVDAEEYRRLQREIVEAEHKLKGLRDKSEETKKQIDGVGKKEKDISKLKESFSIAAKGAMAFGAAVTGIAVGLSNLEESTREYREDLNKLKTAFSAAGYNVTAAKKAYVDFYKILGEEDRSIEAVNHLAELVNNQKELSDWTLIAAGINAKFTDSLPIEGLTEAA